MIRVLVADDHAVVRKGLKQILSETSDIIVTDEASNGQEVFEKIDGNEYEVILLDISMPGRSGLDILKELKLSFNNLTGTIPAGMFNLSKLEKMYLAGNNLSGEIPSIGNLSNLKELKLYKNNLSGSIPEELGNLNNLINLILHENNNSF